MDEVADRLHTSQVQPPLEKRPARELSGCGESDPLLNQQTEDCLLDQHTAVAMQFHHIFGRERTRFTHDDRQHFVHPALRIRNPAMPELMRGGFGKCYCAAAPEDHLCRCKCLWAADADHP